MSRPGRINVGAVCPTYSQLMPIRTWSIRILTLRGNSQIPISKGHLKSDGFVDRRILTLRTRGGATEGKERKGRQRNGKERKGKSSALEGLVP